MQYIRNVDFESDMGLSSIKVESSKRKNIICV